MRQKYIYSILLMAFWCCAMLTSYAQPTISDTSSVNSSAAPNNSVQPETGDVINDASRTNDGQASQAVNSSQQKPYIEDNSIVMSTGTIMGVYYPLGSAICRIINQHYDQHGVRCGVENTSGSIYNINALRHAEADFAIVQSDWQEHAFRGTNIYETDGPYEELRFLFSFYTEALTFIVRSDSDIYSLDDIQGKHINIGNKGSGARSTIEELFAHKGWGTTSFKSMYQFSPIEQIEQLCKGTVDVIILATGHPNGLIQEASNLCEIRILNIADKEVTSFVQNNPDFSFTSIPGGLYFGNSNDIRTFGVKATLVTNTDMSDDIAYLITKSVFEQLDELKRLHPVFYSFNIQDMIHQGQIAPIHEGARRYFIEKGYLEADA